MVLLVETTFKWEIPLREPIPLMILVMVFFSLLDGSDGSFRPVFNGQFGNVAGVDGKGGLVVDSIHY